MVQVDAKVVQVDAKVVQVDAKVGMKVGGKSQGAERKLVEAGAKAGEVGYKGEVG